MREISTQGYCLSLNPLPPQSCARSGETLIFQFRVDVPPLKSSGLEGSSWADPAVSFYIYTVTFNVIILEMRILLVYTGVLAISVNIFTVPLL